ncbi:MAG: hypothetical protein GY861_04730 [bacterium]|nr:hypothetical protein [bacterium]
MIFTVSVVKDVGVEGYVCLGYLENFKEAKDIISEISLGENFKYAVIQEHSPGLCTDIGLSSWFELIEEEYVSCSRPIHLRRSHYSF